MPFTAKRTMGFGSELPKEARIIIGILSFPVLYLFLAFTIYHNIFDILFGIVLSETVENIFGSGTYLTEVLNVVFGMFIFFVIPQLMIFSVFFFPYCLYKVIKGSVGPYFLMLCILGAVGFYALLTKVLPLIQ